MQQFNNYKVTYRSPSNIAFIKYWGKKGRQLPINPSLSMTLSNSYTETTVEFSQSESGFELVSIEVEGVESLKFREKLLTFFNSIIDELSFLKNYKITIKTSNTFPHSAGIASSASGMSALCLCLLSLEAKLENKTLDLNRVSFFSRIASGSASRSIFPQFAHWGESFLDDSSNEFAREIHFENLPKLYDAIAIVSSSEKSVSSSSGHALIESHPYKEGRILQANHNFKAMVSSLRDNNLNEFGVLLEEEALSLHALMMSSNPSFILLEAQSLEVIKLIREFRLKTNLPLYFTIDAGPNIHMIYPENNKDEIEDFINTTIKPLSKKIIFDCRGEGPQFMGESFE